MGRCRAIARPSRMSCSCSSRRSATARRGASVPRHRGWGDAGLERGRGLLGRRPTPGGPSPIAHPSVRALADLIPPDSRALRLPRRRVVGMSGDARARPGVPPSRRVAELARRAAARLDGCPFGAIQLFDKPGAGFSEADEDVVVLLARWPPRRSSDGAGRRSDAARPFGPARSPPVGPLKAGPQVVRVHHGVRSTPAAPLARACPAEALCELVRLARDLPGCSTSSPGSC